MNWLGSLLAGAAVAGSAAAPVPAPETVPGTEVPQLPQPAPARIETAIEIAQVVPEGTPVRLMVIREVTSRNSRAGDRFELRVDEPVFINGKPVIPVGAKAWGEVNSSEGNGAVGKGGKLSARLLYLDLPSGHLPLTGSISQRGDGNSAGVAMAVIGFGVLGLLTAGDSARLKGGQTFTAYAGKVAAAPIPDSADAPPQSGG